MSDKLIILDNGHGQETPGKRSPDGLFREYRWTRDFVKKLHSKLEFLGYKSVILVPEENDIGLTKRCKRVNELCKDNECILISIHNNAAADNGKWYNATGWEAFTSFGNTESDLLAEILYQEIEAEGIKIRSDKTDNDLDKEADFTIINKVNCPAVLTENMFMDSKKDIEFLNSEYGINKLLRAHIIGILRYLECPQMNRNDWVNNNIGLIDYLSQKSFMNKCNYR